MDVQPDDIRDILDAGRWKQGSILPNALVQSLKSMGYLKRHSEGDTVILLSHSCDILNRSLEDEPVIELIIGKTGKRDGRFECGKNPRMIHIRDQRDSKTALIFRAFDREFVPRTLLSEANCDSCLPSEHIEQLTSWIARRYVRPALPDAFHDRISAHRINLRKLYEPASDYVTGIYIGIEDAELPQGEDYEVVIIVTISTVTAENDSIMQEVEKFAADLSSGLDAIEGIAVVNYAVKTHADFSLDDLSETKSLTL